VSVLAQVDGAGTDQALTACVETALIGGSAMLALALVVVLVLVVRRPRLSATASP
jgi:uncharacterized protein (TIGR03382 family)